MITTDVRKPAGGAAGALRGILLTAALSFALMLTLVYAHTLAAGTSFLSNLIVLPLTILGAAGGSSVGVRLVHLNWRQTVLAALLSGVGLIVFSRLEGTPFHPGPWLPGDSGMRLQFRIALVYLAVAGAGTFLLPLFDPAVRRMGTAPTLWKVALAALALLLLLLGVDYLAGGAASLGLVTLILGSIGSAVLVGAGILLVIFRFTVPGAWAGGLGIVLEALTVLAWLLLGRPFFP